MTTIRFRDEMVDRTVILYATTVGRSFVLIDDNACPHRAVLVDHYLESEGIVRCSTYRTRPTIIPLKIFGMSSSLLSVNVPSATTTTLSTIAKLLTHLQEEWQILNYAVDNITSWKAWVIRCKLCTQVRCVKYPLNVLVYFGFKHLLMNNSNMTLF